jgi:hypothetical protein
MIERVPLAIDDTPDSRAATRLAVDLAAALKAPTRAVHLSADHLLDAAVQAASANPPSVLGATNPLRQRSTAPPSSPTAPTATRTPGGQRTVGPAILDAVAR